jgi:hypothetical protein
MYRRENKCERHCADTQLSYARNTEICHHFAVEAPAQREAGVRPDHRWRSRRSRRNAPPRIGAPMRPKERGMSFATYKFNSLDPAIAAAEMAKLEGR